MKKQIEEKKRRLRHKEFGFCSSKRDAGIEHVFKTAVEAGKVGRIGREKRGMKLNGKPGQRGEAGDLRAVGGNFVSVF